MRTTFASVIQAWRDADPVKINPMREHVSEDAYWESGHQQAELVAQYVPEGGTVLDFGCGDGRIAIPLAKLGRHVHAVDAAPEMIERLEHNIAVMHVNSGMIATWVSDGMDDLWPEAVGSYDAVNARAVFIHHAHADVAKLVHNLKATIKPGGFLITDWPLGPHHERRDWIDVTTWDAGKRAEVANTAGLELVTEGNPETRTPSVWVKK